MLRVQGKQVKEFTLQPNLAVDDVLGEGYKYSIREQENGKYVEVWYANYGEWVYDIYTVEEVNKNFEEEIWIAV